MPSLIGTVLVRALGASRGNLKQARARGQGEPEEEGGCSEGQVPA